MTRRRLDRELDGRFGARHSESPLCAPVPAGHPNGLQIEWARFILNGLRAEPRLDDAGSVDSVREDG